MTCKLLGIPVHEGSGRMGCELAPAALRTAGIATALGWAGHVVTDLGQVARGPLTAATHPNAALKALPEIVAWTAAIAQAAYEASGDGVPIFLGGDHSVSGGTLPALARRAKELGRPLFVLWLDAHPDLHTLDTTTSGHLHGVLLAYAMGRSGFEGIYPDLAVPLDPTRITMIGVRSIDAGEAATLRDSGIRIQDQAARDRDGIAAPVRALLDRVIAENGLLHVSFDVDFLDPILAPGAGTTVPGGVQLHEAQIVMDLLHTSGRVTSLDLVELNPLLDPEGRTARLMVDLTARLVGHDARRLQRSA